MADFVAHEQKLQAAGVPNYSVRSHVILTSFLKPSTFYHRKTACLPLPPKRFLSKVLVSTRAPISKCRPGCLRNCVVSNIRLAWKDLSVKTHPTRIPIYPNLKQSDQKFRQLQHQPRSFQLGLPPTVYPPLKLIVILPTAWTFWLQLWGTPPTSKTARDFLEGPPVRDPNKSFSLRRQAGISVWTFRTCQQHYTSTWTAKVSTRPRVRRTPTSTVRLLLTPCWPATTANDAVDPY